MAILYPTDLEKALQCPSCNGELLFKPSQNAHVCPVCQKNYPTTAEGIYDFFPEYQGATGRSQKAMEKGWLVKIYERIWRPVFSWFGTKIKYKDEIAWIEKTKLETEPEIIVDLACGSGKYTRLLARRYPQSLILGLDLSMPMLREANKLAKRAGLSNIVWARVDGQRLPLREDSTDWLNCFGALHLFPDIPTAARGISRVLKPTKPFTCMLACKPADGKLPFLARMALGGSDFQFLTLKEYQDLLQKADLQLSRQHQDRLVLLFEANSIEKA